MSSENFLLVVWPCYRFIKVFTGKKLSSAHTLVIIRRLQRSPTTLVQKCKSTTKKKMPPLSKLLNQLSDFTLRRWISQKIEQNSNFNIAQSSTKLPQNASEYHKNIKNYETKLISKFCWFYFLDTTLQKILGGSIIFGFLEISDFGRIPVVKVGAFWR